MKKILLIPFLFVAFYTFSQTGKVDTLIAKNAKWVYHYNKDSVDAILNSYIKQGGNSLGGNLVFGTNDANTVRIKINGVETWIFGGNDFYSDVNIFRLNKGGSSSSASFTRNTANGYSVFAFNNANNSSNGHIVDYQFVGDTKSYVDKDGGFVAPYFKITDLNPAPASATATGIKGEIRITSTYIYVCTATNTWVRAALSTW